VPLVESGEQTPTLHSLFELGTSPSEFRDKYVFDGLFDLGLTEELAVVLVAMRRYGDSVQSFVDGVPQEVNLAVFCDKRNLLQWSLLSIPSGKDLPESSQPRPIYEATRLAMMIYSLAVIFPLPPQTSPIPILVGELRTALQNPGLRSSWLSTHQARRLLIWILFVGGIAARDVPEDRSWFISVLRGLTAKENRVIKFEDLKRDVLSRILWLDQSCDNAGRLFWAEILDLEE